MKEIKIVIKACDVKPAYGHQSHVSGTGVHKDKRTKRERTRGAKIRKALGEWR